MSILDNNLGVVGFRDKIRPGINIPNIVSNLNKYALIGM